MEKIAIIDFATSEVVRGSFGYDSYILYAKLKSQGKDVTMFEDMTPFKMHRLNNEFDTYIIHFWSYPQIEAIKWAESNLHGKRYYIGYKPLIEKYNLTELPTWDNGTIKKGMEFLPTIYDEMKYGLMSDSVTGNMNILVKKNNKIQSVKIGDFVDSYMNNNKQTPQRKNIKSENYQILTVTKDNNVIWEHLTQLYRHKVDKKLYRIHTNNSYVEVTEDHAVYKLDDKYNLVTVKPEELSKNDTIVGINNLPIKNTKRYELSHFAHGLTNHDNAKKIDLDLPISKDFMTFLGLFVGDGNYNISQSSIFISHGGDIDVIKFLQKFAKKLGVGYSEKTKFDMAINSKQLMQIIINMKFNTGSHEKNIPGWIFDLDTELKCAFLKGYLSADGAVSSKTKYIGWQTVSTNLGQDILTLMKTLNLDINTNILSQKDYRFDGQIRNFKNKKERLITKGTISNYNDIIWFKIYIGFIQAYKNNVLKDINKKNFNTRYQQKIPVLGELKTKYKTQFVHKEEVLNEKCVEHLINTDINFVKIKKIEEIKNYDGTFVYDLTVPETGNFVCNSTMVKNCDLHIDSDDERQVYPLFLSYGCRNHCKFCPISPNREKEDAVNKRLQLSDEAVDHALEMALMTDERNIHFCDEDLFMDLEWSKKLIVKLSLLQERYKTKGWTPFKWIALASIPTFSKLLDEIGEEKLLESGCFLIELGVETAEAELRKGMNKTGTSGQLTNILDKSPNINKFWLSVTFFPGETLYTLNLMGEWLRTHGNTPKSDGARLITNGHVGGFGQFFQPYHGTKMYDELSDKGIFLTKRPVRLIPSYLPLSFLNCVPIKLQSATPDDLKWFRTYLINEEYYNQFEINGEKTIGEYYIESGNDVKLLLYFAMMARLGYMIEKMEVQENEGLESDIHNSVQE